MKFAYADPPYFGLAHFYKNLHPDWEIWNDIKTHANLIQRLCDEYSDGWALSLSEKTLKNILPLCPDDCRVLAWIKPWSSFKPSVKLAYSWEPIILRGGRKRTRNQDTLHSWVVANMAMQKGLRGAKPTEVFDYVLRCLNVRAGDIVDDLFPGTGGMDERSRYFTNNPDQHPLELKGFFS